MVRCVTTLTCPAPNTSSLLNFNTPFFGSARYAPEMYESASATVANVRVTPKLTLPESHRTCSPSTRSAPTYSRNTAPGVSAKTKLDFLQSGVPGLDFETEGRKVVDGDTAARADYYRRVTEPNRFYGGIGVKRLEDALRKGFSCEHMLALCDEALAAVTPQDVPLFIGRKSIALTRLERFKEAEQLLLTSAATTNASLRRTYLGMLGDFYADRATRYYAEPYAPMLWRA